MSRCPCTHLVRAVASLSVVLSFVSFNPTLSAQALPEIGRLFWSVPQSYMVGNEESRFQWVSVQMAPRAGLIIGATNTEIVDRQTHRARYATEIVAFDQTSGAIVHRLPICEDSASTSMKKVRHFSTNDSANVVCYQCDYSRDCHLRPFPNLLPSMDSMLSLSDHVTLSNTGRYLSIQGQRSSMSPEETYIYDRATDSTTITPYFPGSLFTADDRFVAMRWLSNSRPRIDYYGYSVMSLDVTTGEAIDTSVYLGEGGLDVSYQGGLLIPEDDYVVYSIVDMRKITTRTPSAGPVFSSADGELIFGRHIGAESGDTLIAFSVSESRPIGAIMLRDADRLKSKTDTWYSPQQKVPGLIVLYSGNVIAAITYDVASSVQEPHQHRRAVVHPNPTSADVSIDLPTCADGSWTIDLLDPHGRVVRSMSSSCVGNVLQCNVAGVIPGWYVLHARSNAGSTNASALLMILP